MEVEEPSEKVETTTARGECELKTNNETPKQVIKNGGEAFEEEEKEEDGKAEPKRTRVIYSYSWDDLNALKDSPASQVWPDFIEENCIKNGVWDPELWHHTPASAKRCASPVDDIKRQIIMEDGIVLSPQRQSFGQGCHVPQSAPERGSQQERTKSMLSRTIERDTRDGRSRLTGRVGRGSRSIDYRVNQRERTIRNGDLRQTSPWERDRNDKDYKRTKDEDGYGYRKGKKRYEDEPEPEWMTYGPTSNLETIELGGFDREEMFGKRSKTGSFTGSDGTPKANKKGKVEKKNEKNNKTSTEPDEKEKDDKDFDINQFFVSDAFLQFSDVSEKGNSNASRFSQFFGIGERRDGSRRSSAAEELLEYSGMSSASPSTPRTPSPNQGFMFTPIKPVVVDANTEPENLAEMLQKTKIDMKPLLESVMSSDKTDKERVKGQCRLEDLEKTVENGEQDKEPVKQEEDSPKKDGDGQDMSAFLKLVETMKTSGNLPEKPQPVIPGLPSRLLPRPPSPKTNQSSRSPSPLQKLRRSPSPTEVLQHMMQGHRIPSPSAIPSPPQVVPQLDRAYSPYGTPVHKSLEMLQRSPSPINSMYDQPKSFSPLLTPDAFVSPSPMHSHLPIRGSPALQYLDKPHFELPNEMPSKPSYRTPRPTPKPNNSGLPKTTPKSQTSALRDLAFMPTSVLQKIKKDQMTPKSKPDTEESKKDEIENGIENSSAGKTTKQSVLSLSPKVPEQHPRGKQELKSMFQPFSHEATLLKPTAFKPYSGMPSPGSISPLRSGIHSEPQSPVTSRTSALMNHNRLPMPSSAPVTPQRPSHAEHHMSNQRPNFHQNGPTSRSEELQQHTERAFRSIMQENQSKGSIDRGLPNSHEGRFPDETAHLRMQKEMSDHQARQDHERQRQLQQAIQQHQQQQQIRREIHNQMYRNRPTPPHMLGGRVSPQSILGSPGLPLSPYNTPVPNMHPQGKQGIHPSMMRPPVRPPYLRMMPPRIPGMPIQSPAGLMQMMSQHPSMMYGPGHTPMPGHHGYGPMNPPMMPPTSKFPVPRHPGLLPHQGKVPTSMQPHQELNPRSSPNENVLTKWFTEDILRGAQGKPPSVHDKKVMSVEDLERQQAMFAAMT